MFTKVIWSLSFLFRILHYNELVNPIPTKKLGKLLLRSQSPATEKTAWKDSLKNAWVEEHGIYIRGVFRTHSNILAEAFCENN